MCRERRKSGGKTEPLGGDIGGQGHTAAQPGWGLTSRAAVMRKSFLPLCPGLLNWLGLLPGLQTPYKGQRAHTVGTHGGSDTHSSFCLFVYFVYNPLKTEPLCPYKHRPCLS